MKLPGLKHQIMIVTLLPVVLVVLVFSGLHVNTRLDQTKKLLMLQGQTTAQQLASASQIYVQDEDNDGIRKLLQQALKDDRIKRATIYDRVGNPLVELRSPQFDASATMDYLYFREPIPLLPTEPSQSQAKQQGIRRLPHQGWVHLYLSQQQLRVSNRKIVTETVVVALPVLVVMLALAIIAGRKIGDPAARLVTQLQQIERNQLGNPINSPEMNEIKAIDQGLRRMSYALQAHQRELNDRIESSTSQLNETIAELETSNQALEQARTRAIEENRQKSEFLANMSHEIRTPISSIKGFMSLLASSRLDDSQRRHVETVLKSTTDLTDIINIVLDFSKIESGKMDITEKGFDLHEASEQVRDILFVNALSKRIDLNLIIFSDTPRWVIGDRLRYKQILLNLIGNAIKFTEQGAVVVRIRQLAHDDEGEVMIQVGIEDSGIGIAEEDQQYLFKSFSQIDSADTGASTGTGLGLAISQNLATLLSGKINLQSAPGKGSSFTLELPLRLDPREHTEVTIETQQPRGLLLAANRDCMLEVLSLFERAGASVECELISPTASIDAVTSSVQRNLPYLDFVAVDLRHLALDLSKCLATSPGAGINLFGIHYDQSPAMLRTLPHIEFVSITSSATVVSRLLKIDTTGDKPAAASKSSPPQLCRKVLLVDDDPLNLKMASELMRSWGHQVQTAAHASAALELWQQESFDYIVLDIQMPDIDGVSLLQMMRDQRPYDSTPMIALTANVLNEEAERLLQLGFDHFLGKPVDEVKFRAILEQVPAPTGDGNSVDSRIDENPDCSFDFNQSLSLAAGNQSLLRQILEILRQDIPGHQDQLDDATSSKDLKQLSAIVHKLHGVTCYASLPRLKRVLTQMQSSVNQGDFATIRRLAQDIKLELVAINEAVEMHLAKLASNAGQTQDSSTTIATT